MENVKKDINPRLPRFISTVSDLLSFGRPGSCCVSNDCHPLPRKESTSPFPGIAKGTGEAIVDLNPALDRFPGALEMGMLITMCILRSGSSSKILVYPTGLANDTIAFHRVWSGPHHMERTVAQQIKAYLLSVGGNEIARSPRAIRFLRFPVFS